jgi:serine/threonine-protein kinase PpkA
MTRAGRLGASLAAAVLLAAVCLGSPGSDAAGRQPLLIEGKQTLFQRVLTKPGATLHASPGAAGASKLAPLSVFYVYDRKIAKGAGWVEVGAGSRGDVVGWVPAGETIEWRQQLALAFTNPAGRDRLMLFRDRKALDAVLLDPDPAGTAGPLRAKVMAGGTVPEVVALEPETHVDITSQFYLLPILDAEETFMGPGYPVRALEVASVSKDESKPVLDKKAPSEREQTLTSMLANLRAAVVFVIDSTISMDDYIDRTREAVRRIYGVMEQAKLLDRVSFGLVAFRSNVEVAPGLDYVTKVYADPNAVKDGKDFLAKVADLKAARVSSARYSEDAYAGVADAIDQIDWSAFGARYLVLITDAGALDASDELSRTKLDAANLRLEVLEHGIGIYTLHLKTPSGRSNHAIAERQYKQLSTHPNAPRPLYYPIEAGDVSQFGSVVDALAASIVKQVNAAAKGTAAVGTQAAKPGTDAPGDVTEQVRRDSEALGHAMRLAYLGRVGGETAPPLFRAWLADRDFAKPDVASTEVRILLSKNQLSDMERVLKAILEAGYAAQLDPAEFFSRMRSVAATLGRDPARVNEAGAAKLADLGLLGEYLDDLPYKSKVMAMTQDLWKSWSIGEQQVFLDEVAAKLRLYRRIHDDVDRWVVLDGTRDPGDSVYPVPLDALP